MGVAMNEDNSSPTIFEAAGSILKHRVLEDLLQPECSDHDSIDVMEVFETIRYLQDPEHPNLTLEQLKVVEPGLVQINDPHVYIRFTPTVPTCSVATHIGLTIKAKLLRSL